MAFALYWERLDFSSPPPTNFPVRVCASVLGRDIYALYRITLGRHSDEESRSRRSELTFPTLNAKLVVVVVVVAVVGMMEFHRSFAAISNSNNILRKARAITTGGCLKALDSNLEPSTLNEGSDNAISNACNRVE